jgi:hypothetical protein
MTTNKSREQILSDTREIINKYNEQSISYFDDASIAMDFIFQIASIDEDDIRKGFKEFIDNYNDSIEKIKSEIIKNSNINNISCDIDRLKAELHQSGMIVMIALNAASAIQNACFSVLCACSVSDSKPESREERLREYLESAASQMRAARANKPEELALREAIEAERQNREVLQPWKMAEEILDSVNQHLVQQNFPPVNVDRIYRRLKSTAHLKSAEDEDA